MASIRWSIAHRVEDRAALRRRDRRWASVKVRRCYGSSVLTGRRLQPQSRSVPGIECCVYNATLYGQYVTLTVLRQVGHTASRSLIIFEDYSILGRRAEFLRRRARPSRVMPATALFVRRCGGSQP